MHIIKFPNGNLSEINPEYRTVQLTCLEPEVSTILIDIVESVVPCLGWRPSSRNLLYIILCRIAEASHFDSTHEDLGMEIWPELGKHGAKKKIGKHIAHMKEDMRVTGFQAVFIRKGPVVQNKKGEYYSLPSRFEKRDFWQLFAAVQEASRSLDLFSMPVSARRMKVRAICEAFYKSCEFQPIPKKEQAKMERQKGQMKLPATDSEAGGAIGPELGRRVTKADVERRIAEEFDRLFGDGIDWLNLGLEPEDFWRKFRVNMGELDDRLTNARRSGMKLVTDRMNARRRATK
jgi:hypothetical protein